MRMCVVCGGGGPRQMLKHQQTKKKEKKDSLTIVLKLVLTQTRRLGPQIVYTAGVINMATAE